MYTVRRSGKKVLNEHHHSSRCIRFVFKVRLCAERRGVIIAGRPSQAEAAAHPPL